MKIPKEEKNVKIDVEMKVIYKAADNPVKAIAVVILEDSLVIHNIKIIDLGDGPFLSMPSRRGRDGKWRNLCHPSNSTFRKELQEKVLAAYLAG